MNVCMTFAMLDVANQQPKMNQILEMALVRLSNKKKKGSIFKYQKKHTIKSKLNQNLLCLPLNGNAHPLHLGVRQAAQERPSFMTRRKTNSYGRLA